MKNILLFICLFLLVSCSGNTMIEKYYGGKTSPVPTETLESVNVTLVVTTSPALTPTPGETCRVPDIDSGVTTVNIREGPGTKYKVIGSAREGEIFEVKESTDEWINVYTGWMYKKYCITK